MKHVCQVCGYVYDEEKEGVPFAELNLKSEVLVAGIVREGSLIVPGGQDCILEGDAVIIVTTHSGFGDITDILAETSRGDRR